MKLFSIVLSVILGLLIFTSCSDIPTTVSSDTDTEQDSPAELSVTESKPTEETPIETDITINPDSVLAEVSTINIYGEAASSDIFFENELTLVNVWATWCPPCVAEMPELAELEKELKAEGIGVVGIVTDLLNTDGTINDEKLNTARLIAEQSGVLFEIVLPDEVLFNEFLASVQVFPTSFLVDSNGNIVENIYEGARDKAGWLEVINDNLPDSEG